MLRIFKIATNYNYLKDSSHHPINFIPIENPSKQ